MKQEGAFFQAKKQILIILSFFVIVGYTIDLFLVNNDPKTTLANLIAIGIVIGSILLTYLSIFSVKFSFSVIVYSLIANIFITHFFNIHLYKNIEVEVLRAAIIIAMLLPVAGFVIEKKHTLYIGILLMLFLFLSIVISHNRYIIDNIYLLVTMLVGYTSGIFYLLYLLENGALKQKKLIAELEAKNSELERTNSLLSELNSYIEIQKEELKNTVESREKLMAIISHDIKNPLSTIISFSDLIKSKLNPKENESVHLYIRMIQQSANNLFSLIITLLDWTRLQSGKIIVKKGLFDTGVRIYEAIALLDNSLKNKNIEVRVINVENIEIVADRHMFSAIIRNLLSNAIKFTPLGGKVTIESRIDAQNYYCIVSDNGVGMKQEDIDLVLNGNKNMTTEGTLGESGTGFGLELCREFVILHKGELKINSQLGVGTEFIVSLPLDYSE